MSETTDPRTRLQRWADAFTHSGPGYDLTAPAISEVTARPVTPEMEAAATARAVEAAADSERVAEWIAAHSQDSSELESLRREVAAARNYAAEMREFCSPHGVSVRYADQLEAAMDRAKEGGR